MKISSIKLWALTDLIKYAFMAVPVKSESLQCHSCIMHREREREHVYFGIDTWDQIIISTFWNMLHLWTIYCCWWKQLNRNWVLLILFTVYLFFFHSQQHHSFEKFIDIIKKTQPKNVTLKKWKKKKRAKQSRWIKFKLMCIPMIIYYHI